MTTTLRRRRILPTPAAKRSALNELFTWAGRHDGPVSAVDVSKNGRRVVSLGEDNHLGLWNLDQQNNFRSLRWPNGERWQAVVLFANGKRAWTAWGGNQLYDLDLETTKATMPRAFIGHTAAINSVDLSPDEKRISCGDDRSIRLSDIEKKAEIRHWHGHEKAILFVRFTAKGKRALTRAADGTVRLWDVETGQRLLGFKSASVVAALSSASISPEGDCLVLSLADKTARVYDYARKIEIARLEGHHGAIHSTLFSPDGRYLITVSDDGKLQRALLWCKKKENAECALLAVPHRADGSGLHLDRRRIVAGGKDGTIRVWEIKHESGSLSKVTAADLPRKPSCQRRTIQFLRNRRRNRRR